MSNVLKMGNGSAESLCYHEKIVPISFKTVTVLPKVAVLGPRAREPEILLVGLDYLCQNCGEVVRPRFQL